MQEQLVVIADEQDALDLREIVFAELNKLGITEVEVEFEGQDGESELGLTSFENEPDSDIDLDFKAIEIHDPETGKPVSLEEAIEKVCQHLLSENHEYWKDDLGADGLFTLDVVAREIRLRYDERFIDTFSTQETY